MSVRLRAVLFGALAALLALALMMAVPALVWQLLTQDLRARLIEGLAEQWPAVVMLMLFVSGAAVWSARALWAHFEQPAQRMAEQVSLLCQGEGMRGVSLPASPALGALAQAINQLAASHAQLSAGMQASVDAARADTERERRRLAALIEDLAEAMVVCNAEGRILLYNRRASRLFAGTGLLGLGRDISSLIDPAHMALVRERLSQGGDPAQLRFMITTRAGRLVRIRASGLYEEAVPVGLVVMAEDVTTEAEQAARRLQGLQALADMQQAVLADITQQLRRLAQREDLSAESSTELTALGEGSARLAAQLRDAMRDEQASAEGSILREDMRGLDLLRAAQRRIESRLGLTVHLDAPDEGLRLSVDSFLLTQVMGFLATRVWEACDARSLSLSLQHDGAQALLGMRWSGTALSYESALGWELEPMRLGGEASSLSVREVVRQHAGELRYERDRAATQSRFSLLLPLGAAAESSEPQTRTASSYDFDLFNWHAGNAADEDRHLADLAFTVFDTETTGLDPAGGDEIIQIGALRILRGKLLREERFEQLIDPQRDIAPASFRIHGISRDSLRGQPLIGEVLQRFHVFAADSVLVGHNVAFDMRFLQIKETQTGLRFDHAVLDTLLLSSVLHPNQESHSLEAIAERLGVGVFGRHDAMADALMTAQIFQRMIPLLAAQGIRTLGEARLASHRSKYAQVRY